MDNFIAGIITLAVAAIGWAAAIAGALWVLDELFGISLVINIYC